jgi:hypothetical protein
VPPGTWIRSCEHARMQNEHVVLTSTLRALSLTGRRKVVITLKIMIFLRHIPTQRPGCTIIIPNSSSSAIRPSAKSQDRVGKPCPLCARALLQGASHCSENSPIALSRVEKSSADTQNDGNPHVQWLRLMFDRATPTAAVAQFPRSIVGTRSEKARRTIGFCGSAWMEFLICLETANRDDQAGTNYMNCSFM